MMVFETIAFNHSATLPGVFLTDQKYTTLYSKNAIYCAIFTQRLHTVMLAVMYAVVPGLPTGLSTGYTQMLRRIRIFCHIDGGCGYEKVVAGLHVW